MNLALYAPQKGYYVSGLEKLGASGDFMTAPELTPLFAQGFARQFAEIFRQETLPKNILELGAGSGKFAIDNLWALRELGVEIDHYFILEISPSLKEKQQSYAKNFPDFFGKMCWLEALPEPDSFSGIMFANEVLDAMPVHRFVKTGGKILEQTVQLNGQGKLEYGSPLPPSSDLLGAIEAIESRCGIFPEGYLSEVNLWVRPWLTSLSQSMKAGVLILVDYGYSEAEFYAPFRHSGTLMCYSRHRTNADPLLNPGEQDITAHVNFSEVADAGIAAGFELAAYTTQGLFLANVLKNLGAVSPAESQHLRRLMHPEAMGEIFKVILFEKNLASSDRVWEGFLGVDQRHRL